MGTINAQGLLIQPKAGGKPVEAAGVFTIQSCFNHSCIPNARISTTGCADISLELLSDVAEGDEITISYLPQLVLELEPFHKRRERLRSYFFTCGCPKCAEEERQ